MEVVVTLSLVSLAMVVLGRVLIVASQLYVQSFERSYRLTEMTRSLHLLKRELRDMDREAILKMKPGHLVFLKRNGNKVNYQLKEDLLMRNKLTALDRLKSFQLSYLDANQLPATTGEELAFVRITAVSKVGEAVVECEELVYVAN